MPRPWSDYNRYLNTVRYADELLGAVVAQLAQRQLLDDTLIVVVGDHGQGFFEHGQKAHNTVIWEEGLRVPLVLHNRQLFPEPRVVDGLRRQVDIVPTVLTQLGVSYPSELFEGHDLLTGSEHQRAYSSCWYDRRCAAETTGLVRVIDHFDNQPMEVYDLAADPFERTNLLATGPRDQRARWDVEAKAARERIRKHHAEIEQGYASVATASSEFLLKQEPTPSYPIQAQLENSIELLGYDTPTLEATPDSFWEAVVYFKCIGTNTEGWRLFGVLETSDGREEQVDHHPANGQFYLHQCKPGTIVADHVRVWIPGDFPPGEVRYWWGSVLLKDLGHVTRENRRLGRREIRPLQRGVLVRNQALLLAKLQIAPKYRTGLTELRKTSISTKAPDVKKPIEVKFGDNLVLVEARVEPTKVRRRASVMVTTVWRVEGEQSGPWQINVHLDSDRLGYWLRRAHTPVDGVHPISAWKPGTWIIDTHAIPVPDYLPAGGAKVWVGVRTATRRMEVTDEGHGEVLDRRALAGAVQIEP